MSFEFTPDFSASKSSKPNVTTVKFGDGYESRFATGLNPDLKTWSVKFSNRTVAEIDEIEDFLETMGGVTAFAWTPPRATDEINVKCAEWSRSIDNASYDSLTATFVQVAEP